VRVFRPISHFPSYSILLLLQTFVPHPSRVFQRHGWDTDRIPVYAICEKMLQPYNARSCGSWRLAAGIAAAAAGALNSSTSNPA